MLSRNDKIKALCWKSDELGISYGKLMCKSTRGEIAQIYDEYERLLSERKNRSRQTAAPRENHSGRRVSEE